MGRSYVRGELLGRCNRQITEQVNYVDKLFSSHDDDTLLTSPLPGAWSAKQCLDHLIATLNLYLPRIEDKLKTAPAFGNEQLKHGYIGYKFFTDILPTKDGKKMRKMKTFKRLKPVATGNTIGETVRLFESKMKAFNALLEQSSDKNIQRLKVTSAAGAFLKLRLGDVYPFILNHNHRHIVQAEKAIQINLKRKGLAK